MLAKIGTNASGATFGGKTSGTTYNWQNLEPMQVAGAGEITQVKESIPGVRCASGNVFIFCCD